MSFEQDSSTPRITLRPPLFIPRPEPSPPAFERPAAARGALATPDMVDALERLCVGVMVGPSAKWGPEEESATATLTTRPE